MVFLSSFTTLPVVSDLLWGTCTNMRRLVPPIDCHSKPWPSGHWWGSSRGSACIHNIAYNLCPPSGTRRCRSWTYASDHHGMLYSRIADDFSDVLISFGVWNWLFLVLMFSSVSNLSKTLPGVGNPTSLCFSRRHLLVGGHMAYGGFGAAESGLMITTSIFEISDWSRSILVSKRWEWVGPKGFRS